MGLRAAAGSSGAPRVPMPPTARIGTASHRKLKPEPLRAVLAAHLLLACGACAAATAPEPAMRRVEGGLLPLAATELGVPTGIRERMQAYGVPGLSVAVIEHGQVAWARGYGVADSGSRQPVTTDTLFQAASISKPVSALGVLLLVQQGRLRLDEQVNDALKHWQIPDTQLTRGHPVTVRMLLNHTAGLEHADAAGYVPFSPGDPLPTLLQILAGAPPARAGPVRVTSTPGGVFHYSGAGYEVLQQLVTEVSGNSFEAYMQSQLLQPLGMRHSTFLQPVPAALAATAASGHYAGGQVLPGRYRVSPELTVAGLWTTPSDVARYVIGVQRSYAGEGPLEPELARQMLTAGAGGRGLGPVLSGPTAARRFGHDGFNEGFECSFVGYVDGGRGAVVMANSGFAFMLIREVLDSISRAYGWPAYGPTGQQPPAAAMGQQRVVPLTAAALARVPGEYQMADGPKIRLRASAGRLWLEWPGNGVTEVYATPEGDFFCPPLIFSDAGAPWLRLSDGNRVLRNGPAGSARVTHADAVALKMIR
jgi:CubicO group peptidase (beta-lactamase class C family)